MAASIQALPLLALPLELRISVYKQLLNPDPDWLHTLYDDHFDREIPFPIHTSILRANKQIYSEAVSILYDTARLQIYLGTPVIQQRSYRDFTSNVDEPPKLFRTDSEGAFESKDKIKWCNPPSSVRSRQFEAFDPPSPGYIYPHCFQRLRKVHLITSREAMWETEWRDEWFGSYFSPTDHLVLRILRLLAQAQVTKSLKRMHFKFSIHADWHMAESQPLMRNGQVDQKTKTIVGLLKALGRRMNADIEEVKEWGVQEWAKEDAEVGDGTITRSLKYWKLEEWTMEDAEVDEWEKVLLSDSDIDLRHLDMRFR